MGVVLLVGLVNVIMELVMLGVGYGVLESCVESGWLDCYLIKWVCIIFIYVVVVVVGSDDQKVVFCCVVNKVYVQVYLILESLVFYYVFDFELQLWVVVCFYKGGVDVYCIFVGEMDDEEVDYYYCVGMVMGIMLQVLLQMWLLDWVVFDCYWW